MSRCGPGCGGSRRGREAAKVARSFGSGITGLSGPEQALNSAQLSEELTHTANTQYSLVERFNR